MVSTRAGGNGTAQDSLHLANEVVDEVLALAELSTLDERAELADLGASKSVGELEGLCRQNTQRAVPGEQRSGGVRTQRKFETCLKCGPTVEIS